MRAKIHVIREKYASFYDQYFYSVGDEFVLKL